MSFAGAGCGARSRAGSGWSLHQFHGRSESLWRSSSPTLLRCGSRLAAKHGLAEPDLNVLASAWHTDADLGRPIEVVTDMSKSRKLGFLDYQATNESFFQLVRCAAGEAADSIISFVTLHCFCATRVCRRSFGPRRRRSVALRRGHLLHWRR